MAAVKTKDLERRINFAKFPEIIGIPNLIEIQRGSFQQFLQLDVSPERREETGLQGVFASIFPISDYEDSASLEFVRYDFGEPKYTPEECREKGMTFSVPLKVTLRLVVWDKSGQGTRGIRDVKEQEVYLGEMPVMSEHGTFIINGTERVVVSQLHRSPGAVFDHDGGKTHSGGKVLYHARLIPNRGSWLEFEFDANDILHVRVDRRRKFLITILLRAIGYGSNEEILALFYERDKIRLEGSRDLVLEGPSSGWRTAKDLADPKGKSLRSVPSRSPRRPWVDSSNVARDGLTSCGPRTSVRCSRFANRSSGMRPNRKTTPWSRSTAECVPAIRQPWKAPGRYCTTCFSIRAGTICPRWGALS
jgi:DNA-directed RNA polymerase subunit beta